MMVFFAKRFVVLLLCALIVVACETRTTEVPPIRPFGADNDYDACTKRCNRTFDRCEDRGEPRSKEFLFFDTVGGGAGCRKDLLQCFDTCKARLPSNAENPETKTQ